jgi:hypothetical protein
MNAMNKEPDEIARHYLGLIRINRLRGGALKGQAKEIYEVLLRVKAVLVEILRRHDPAGRVLRKLRWIWAERQKISNPGIGSACSNSGES